MSSRPTDPAASLGQVAAGLLALAVLVPPETDGRALAGCAGLAALATLLAAWSGAVGRAATLACAAFLLAAMRARFADAPGEAVLPVAIAGLAAAGGLATAAAVRGGERASTLLRAAHAAAAAWAGARGVYEV